MDSSVSATNIQRLATNFKVGSLGVRIPRDAATPKMSANLASLPVVPSNFAHDSALK